MRLFIAFTLGLFVLWASVTAVHHSGAAVVDSAQVALTPLASPTPTSGVQSIPLSTFLPSIPSATPTLTPSPVPTDTLTPTPTITPTPTLTPTPTPPLWTPTPAVPGNAGFYANPTADFTTPEGWSCGDFPCADDIAGFEARIRVPVGYRLDHFGQLPGQPQQITFGLDGRLYATLITDPVARTGAVYALDAGGNAERISAELVSPIGLAFQPGTDVLYVSARVTLESGGGLWRVTSDGATVPVIDDLPCCFDVIDNQPAGIAFGTDGYLYLGVSSLTDRAEPPNPRIAQYAELHPQEATILRIQPHTGEISVYARGVRHPYGLTFDSLGRLFVTDSGLLAGPGDRLLRVVEGAHYGWPYWRGRGCSACPIPSGGDFDFRPDLLRLPDYTLPRGLTAYTGTQFPSNLFNNLFVALWHNTPDSQRVVRIDPAAIPSDPSALAEYQPEPFITGLIRPVDVAVAPDGSLVVADFIYGHVWRVRFDADAAIDEEAPAPAAASPLFVTSTPRP